MEIKPTRSELMKLKKKIKLARSGYKLLKKKRDGLILEFFEILKKTKTVRKELTEKYKEARHKLNMARLLASDIEIRSAAMAIKDKPEIIVETRNIMGVIVPRIESTIEKRRYGEEGYGTVTTSIAVMEATRAYAELLEYILLVAEVETSIKKLLGEIEKTKRRVNALEFDVIPKMIKLSNFISLRLEEQERESIFRTKRIKSKR
ncbi:V-type ATP synthase subunit D [Candidatus Woesearchaeota archaeon]|nr:V-type ATP synthase subunit D [Candidatus Woesearchaeota archaeon]